MTGQDHVPDIRRGYGQNVTRHVRGLILTAVAIVGIANIIDGADDGFSVWNVAAIVWFLAVLARGWVELGAAGVSDMRLASAHGLRRLARGMLSACGLPDRSSSSTPPT